MPDDVAWDAVALLVVEGEVCAELYEGLGVGVVLCEAGATLLGLLLEVDDELGCVRSGVLFGDCPNAAVPAKRARALVNRRLDFIGGFLNGVRL